MVIDHMLISKYKYESKSVLIPFDRKSTISQCSALSFWRVEQKTLALCVQWWYLLLTICGQKSIFSSSLSFLYIFNILLVKSVVYAFTHINFTVVCNVTSSLKNCSSTIIIIFHLKCFCNLHQKHGKKTLLSSLKVIPNKTCKHTLITYIFPLIIFDNFYVCFS